MDPRPLPDLSARPRLPRARADLEYVEAQLGGEDVVVIRDPVQGVYFRYNPLQAAMLRALDGRRTVEDILAELGDRYEVEIPRAAGERFIEHARKQLLLDISQYPIPPGKVHARVARALRRRGFAVRPARDGAPRALPADPGLALLADGLARLEAGDFTGAVGRLTSALEARPHDARCRELLQAIEHAYVRAAAPRSTDFPTYPLFDPDRLLGILARIAGPVLFSWVGVLGMAGLLVWALHAYTELSFADVRIGPFDVAVGIALCFGADLIHELSHGLACKHYGGPVHEIGIFLQFHVQPLPYCDTSSSYLFTHKRHKLIVQMAGTIGSVMVSAVLVLLLAVVPRTVVVYPGLLVAFGINTSFVVALNLIPFVKYDGYYALADHLGIPNLRERSFEYLRVRLQRALLGEPPPAVSVQPRERRIFLLYAPLSASFTVLWVVLVYSVVVFEPLVERLQGFGLVLGLLIVGVLSRNMIARPAWRAVVFAVTHWRALRRPRLIGAVACVVGLLVGPFAVPWPTMVDAPFTLAPRQRALVRAETEGLVLEIPVREGERVQAGQVIARLRNDALARELSVLDAAIEQAGARLARLEAGARPQELDILRHRLERANAVLAEAEKRAARAAALAAREMASAAEAEAAALDRAHAEAEAVAASKGLALLEAGARKEAIDAARAARAALLPRRAELAAALARLTVHSPLAGVVSTARPQERQGMLARRGDLILEVHDPGELIAELALGPASPLREVREGDRVELRATGAPSQAVVTAVERLSPAVRANEPVLVAFTSPFAFEPGRSGMHGHARIYGERRMLGYTLLYLPLRRMLDVELWSLW